MRGRLVGALAALVFGAVVAFAQSSRDFMIQGTTQKVFKEDHVLLMKIENVIPEGDGPDAARAGIQVGSLIYVHVDDSARVVDDEGKDQRREGKKDVGWDAIDDRGDRLQVVIGSERRELRVEGKDLKGNVQGFDARRVQVLKKKGLWPM
jgi:hypothetical protein